MFIRVLLKLPLRSVTRDRPDRIGAYVYVHVCPCEREETVLN